MKYEVQFTIQFKKDLKLAKKQNKNLDKLFEVIDILANGGTLDPKYRDHDLTGNYKGTRECHIESDWLLIYDRCPDHRLTAGKKLLTLRSSVLLLTTRDFIDEVFKVHFKGCDPVMTLFQKQLRLPFKQSCDNLRSFRGEAAAGTDTARSERCYCRNQCVVCAPHNVPSDSVSVFPT